MKNDKKVKSKVLEYVVLVTVFLVIASVIMYLNLESESESANTENLKDLGESPTIELIGEKRVIQPLGDVFEESGVKAIDAYGNDISEEVIVKGEVNTEEEGTNFLYYTVSDMHGNESREIVRLVTVREEYEEENHEFNLVLDDEFLEEVIVQEIERHEETIQEMQNPEDINPSYRYEDCEMVQFLFPYVDFHFNITEEHEYKKIIRTKIREVLNTYESQ